MANDNKTAAQQRSLDAIKPHEFKPGQSGNPKGAPKAKTWLYSYFCGYFDMEEAELKREIVKAEQGKLKQSQVAALQMVKAARAGDWKILREIIDRDEGKVPQGVNLAANAGAVITITDNRMTDAEHSARMAAQAVAISSESEK